MMRSDDHELAAVLFDMDGTLIDSEKLWTLALDEVAAELGGRLSPQARLAIVGTDLVGSIRLLIEDLGVDAEPSVMQRLLVSATAAHFETSIEWQPGAAQLLATVREAGLATALVTSTHRNLTSVALKTIGRDNFDVVICGDDVERTKPDPQPYLRALGRLAVPAPRAVAIEDSVAGSAAAAAAGLATLVVPSEVPVPPGPRLTIVDSLLPVGLDTLRALLPSA